MKYYLEAYFYYVEIVCTYITLTAETVIERVQNNFTKTHWAVSETVKKWISFKREVLFVANLQKRLSPL
jgi:hypothetical protein